MRGIEMVLMAGDGRMPGYEVEEEDDKERQEVDDGENMTGTVKTTATPLNGTS